MSDGKLLLGDFGAMPDSEAVQARIVDRQFCLHRRYELDDVARKIICLECNSEQDPFTVLLDYACGERNWKHYEGECLRAARRLADLQEQERLTKARTRSANRKDADAVRLAERQMHVEALSRALWCAREMEKLARKIQFHLNPGNLPVKADPDV
jgi:hypothetical protein